MNELRNEILKHYPTIAAFAKDAKISNTRLYDIMNGKAKLTPIMKRRILLSLKARERDAK